VEYLQPAAMNGVDHITLKLAAIVETVHPIAAPELRQAPVFVLLEYLASRLDKLCAPASRLLPALRRRLGNPIAGIDVEQFGAHAPDPGSVLLQARHLRFVGLETCIEFREQD